MSNFGYTPGPDFERFLRTAEDGRSRLQEMKERIAEVVGRGEAADGRISAEFRTEGGLTALDLDPRVLRLPSDELSREIRTAVNAAAQDYQDKVRAVSAELFGGENAAEQITRNPQAAMAEVEKLADGFAVQMRELVRELTTQQQRARAAMQQLLDPGQGR